MQIPSVTIGIKQDGTVEVYHASTDKSKAVEAAKAKANEPTSEVIDIRVVCAIGAGLAWRRRVVPSAPVEESDSDPDAKEIRSKLVAKGVKVPPRISLETLLDLAIKHGVEV
jgi:hypothetical protein